MESSLVIIYFLSNIFPQTPVCRILKNVKKIMKKPRTIIFSIKSKRKI